jgi:peroxiredoxin
MDGIVWARRLLCACFIGLIWLVSALAFAADLSLLYEKLGFSVPHSFVLARDFQLEDLKGKTVSLRDFRGKIILLNFWATWCKPCVAEMEDIEKLHRKYKDRDFAVLTINFGENIQKVKNFVTENKLTLTVLLDPEKEVSRRYRTFALPTSYLVDKNGYLLAGTMGTPDWKSKDFQTLLESLLNTSEHTSPR